MPLSELPVQQLSSVRKGLREHKEFKGLLAQRDHKVPPAPRAIKVIRELLALLGPRATRVQPVLKALQVFKEFQVFKGKPERQVQLAQRVIQVQRVQPGQRVIQAR